MSDGFRMPQKTLRIVAVLYVVNLIIAGLPALALYDSLVSSYGESQIASGLDFTAFSDLVEHHGESLLAVLQQFPKILVLSILLNALLTGGVLRALTSSGQGSILQTLMGGTGEFAGRFLRLLTLAICLAAVVAVFTFAGLWFLWGTIAGDPTDEVQTITRLLIGVAGVGAALWLVTILADYTRVRMVLNNERSVVRSFNTSVKFILSQPGTVMALQTLVLVILAATVLLYTLSDSALSGLADRAMVVGIALQQAFIIARLWVRVATFGSQITLVRQRGTDGVGAAVTEQGSEAYRSRL
jgi:hypothetical protein